MNAKDELNKAGIDCSSYLNQDGTNYGPINTERHTAIHCTHSPASLQKTIGEIVKHYAPHAPNSLAIELASTFTQIMWDHADEIAGAYKDILRRNR